MRREREAYLWDIIDAIKDIGVYVQNATGDQAWAKSLLQTAVERKLEVIGEAMKQMEASFPRFTANLPKAKLAMGMRDWLAHGYFDIRPELVWKAVHEELPPLKLAAERELASPPINQVSSSENKS